MTSNPARRGVLCKSQEGVGARIRLLGAEPKIKRLEPGEDKQVRMRFVVPEDFSRNVVPLLLSVDVRRSTVSVAVEVSMDLLAPRPVSRTESPR